MLALFKDNIRAYWHLLKGVWIVTRVMVFEKFIMVFFAFYLLCVLGIALIVSVLHWGGAVVVLLLGLLLFSKVLKSFQFLKRALIRRGDIVEYADPEASENAKMFKKATIVLKMRFDEVKKTKLISDELMQGSEYFYLVEIDKKPGAIAYDWVIGLSPELLDIEFED